MVERELELKRLKRLNRQAKRKIVTGFQVAAIISLVIALAFAPVGIALQRVDNGAAIFLDSDFWRLKKPDSTANYFPGEDLKADALLQTQLAGMVLLKNENNALPLQPGTAVRCHHDKSLCEAMIQSGFLTDESADTVVLGIYDVTNTALLQTYADKKSSGEVKTFIVILNAQTAVPMELLSGYGIDALLWCGGVEDDAVAKVLMGANPAGSLPATWYFAGSESPTGSIYTGYKYYETRYEDFAMGTEKTGGFAYGSAVAYPFGFGLGYTTFSYSDMAVAYDLQTDRFALTVTVTNTGSVAGRKTVQVYAQSPYTDYDRQNGVEKPAVQLAGFAKTAELAPGSSETVTVYVDKGDLASYDAKGAGTYILDAGDYYLTVASDAHNATNNILAAKGYTVENTEGRMDADGDVALTYKWTQNALDSKTYATATGGAAVMNRLPVYEQARISRQDWEGTLANAPVSGKQEVAQYSPGDHASVPMPTVGAKNGLKLYDVIGLAFDDPKWQTLLDQLTFDDMVKTVGDGYSWTMPVASVQAPGARHGEYAYPATQALLAATFDTELMYQAGLMARDTAVAQKETVLYCFGDGFEDSFLTGKMRAAQVQGLRNGGVNAVLKAEEMPTADEQTLREQYFRALQYAVEENPTTGVMSDEGMLAELLRTEWGGKGMVLAQQTPTPENILSGVTVFGVAETDGKKELATYENDPVIVSSMRQACHYNLYALANSAAMNGIGAGTAVKSHPLPLVMVCWVVVAVSTVAVVLFIVLWIRGSKKWKKTQVYLDYQTLRNTLKEEKKL